MNASEHTIKRAILLASTAVGLIGPGASWAALSKHSVLNISAGSHFVMEVQPDFFLPTTVTGNEGLVVSTAQAASGSHTGPINGTENPGIDNPWGFFGNTGMHGTQVDTNVLSASGNTATIDMSGWYVTWNGIPVIDMSTGAWNNAGQGWTGNVNGVAQISCGVDCGNGDTYTLQYTARVPVGDPSGFGGVAYGVKLMGTVTDNNDAPVASNTTINTTALVTWQATVSDAQSDPLTCEIVDQPAPGEGTATITDPNCTIGTVNGSYDPGAFVGNTFFTYRACDDSGACSTAATATVTVSATPAPTAVNDSADTDAATPVVIDVLANDTDGDDNLDPTSVIASNGTYGTTSADPVTGAVTYTPASAAFSGTDTFTYTVEDLDNQISNVATVAVTVRATGPSSSSGTFVPGATAASVGSTTGGGLTTADVGVDSAMGQQCIGGCFDFTVGGLTPGATVQVVLPLSTALPSAEGLVYRKLIGGSWINFSATGNNRIASAPAVTMAPLVCPQPGSSAYTNGLTAGHQCLRLSIVDGGPNDADGLAGTVTDPGGVATPAAFVDTRTSGSSGCTLTTRPVSGIAGEWLLIGGLLAGLGLYRRRLMS